MLSGLAKEKFEKWLLDHEMHNQGGYNFDYPKWFSALHPSFQWGVYQDWADSIGYHIETYIWYCMDDKNNYYGAEVRYQDISDFNKTRQEARNAAIEKLNELINEK